MLIWTARFSKKKAVCTVIIAGLVMALLIVLTGRMPDSEPAQQPELTTNEERVSYLDSLGWQVAPEPVETLQFLLPAQLEGTYLAYNELQLTQGFDLTPYCGKQLSRYTYTVTNYPNRQDGVQVNLYLYENRPVAGDILCPGEVGFQETLAFPETEN